MIEKELIEIPQNEEVIEVKPIQIKEQKFIPKLKTSIVSRPIFTNNYERYEWHMQNGCIGSDDREWLKNYIQSSEFKEIYG